MLVKVKYVTMDQDPDVSVLNKVLMENRKMDINIKFEKVARILSAKYLLNSFEYKEAFSR